MSLIFHILGRLFQNIILFCLIVFHSFGCGDSGGMMEGPNEPDDRGDLIEIPYEPDVFTIELPEYFPRMEIPEDNPMTREGVELGRRLFYDPILSLDSTVSCGTCHRQEHSFADGQATSIGVGGNEGRRSAMSLLNIGLFYNGLFWDGRSGTLEDQALIPVEDPIEMHESWPNVEQKLRRHHDYPARFRRAFGIQDRQEISKELVAKALSQFQRTLVSYNSKFDQAHYQAVPGLFLSEDEFNGQTMFFDHSGRLPDAECGHCHNMPLFTTNEYFNNGIQEVDGYYDFSDFGLGEVTGNQFDNGKFRAPSLRNIALTAPYMHDGRFQTLEEVMDHYNSGGHFIGNVDPLIRPLGLTEEQKKQIIAFLHTLTDTTVLTNPAFSNPF